MRYAHAPGEAPEPIRGASQRHIPRLMVAVCVGRAQNLDDLIANVEKKHNASSLDVATRALSDISGGEKSYSVDNKHWKGKKIAVPGKKEKHKVGATIKLQIGALGVKVMDGGIPIESFLLQKLISWESDEDSLRLLFHEDSGKKGQGSVEFGTKEGAAICEEILKHAKELAKQKKQDRKAEQERKKKEQEEAAQKTAEENERMAAERAVEEAKQEEEEAKAAAEKAKEIEAQEAGIQAIFVEEREVTYSVKQLFWKGPGRLVNGKKVAETVDMKVSKTEVKICDPGNGGTIPEWLVDTIQIHNIVSWRTFKHKLTLSIRKGTLSSAADFEGHMDFETDQGNVITTVLFKIAEELAKKKKHEKAERKKREKEQAEAKAREEADQAARQAMQFEDNVTELYLDTLRQFKVNDLLPNAFAAYDAGGGAPPEENKEDVDAVQVANDCKAAGGDAAKLTSLLQQLSWAKTPDGSDGPLTTTEVTLVAEIVADVAETTAEYVESASLAFVNLVGKSKASKSIRSRLVDKGGLELSLKWLVAHQDSVPACRGILMLLTCLLDSSDEAARAAFLGNSGVSALLGVLDQYTTTPDELVTAGSESATVHFSNPQFSPIVDVLEKACHCLATVAIGSAQARQEIYDAGGTKSVIKLLSAVQTPSVLACGISGVLTSLLDTRNVYNEGEVDGAAEIAKRMTEMIADDNLIESIIGAQAHSMSDLTLGSSASLVLRALKSERKDQVAASMFEADEDDVRPVQVMLDMLNRVAGDRSVEALSVSMIMFAIGHLAAGSPEWKEKIVGMGALQSVMVALQTHKKNRMVQESCLLFIHMLTTNLPEDVQMMLPSYMGISAEQIEAEHATTGVSSKYSVVRKAALRAESDVTSKSIGSLKAGEVIEVLEQMTNHLGQTRVRILRDGKDAWTSVMAKDGQTLLEKVEMDDLDERLDAKAKQVMKLVFRPLHSFGDDDSTAAAMLYASKTLCKGSTMLTTAVCEGGPLKWIVKAMENHSNHAEVAQGACDTIAVLVSGSKRNQKHVRKTKFTEALATVLDLHSDNRQVMGAAFKSLKAMMSVGEKATELFCKKLVELDGAELVAKVIKEQPEHQDILSMGLDIRNKMSKFAPEKKDAESAKSKGGAEPASIFALPLDAKKKDKSEDSQAKDEPAGDEFALLQDLMSDMFSCRQSHIKKAPKLCQLQIGSMGLTFYDKQMKPLENLMYMKLNSWTASKKIVDIFVADETKKDGRKITLKFDDSDDAHKVVSLMEEKAQMLAVQHKKKRKFKVKQTHIEDEPKSVMLQVGDDSVLLIDPASDEKIVAEIRLDTIEKWEKRVIADGSRQKKCLVLTMLEGEEISLGADKAEAIVRLMNDRSKESAEKAEAAVDEEAAQEPEPEPEAEPEAEEGVPPEDAADDAEGTEEAAAKDEESEEEQEPESEEEEEEGPPSDDFTVIQETLRGSRRVDLAVKRSGLMLSDAGDTVVYAFANLQSWKATPGVSCTVCVSAGAGLVTDFTFNTDESVAICKRLQFYACEIARANLLAGMSGSKAEPESSGTGSDADLVAKLQALQAENQKLAEEKTKESASQGGGGEVNAEMAAALKATQSELQDVKKKLEAARKSQAMKKKTDTEGASDQSSRIVELEQKLEMAGKELHSAKESVAAAKAEGAASAQEELKSSQTECESWKRKAEAAEDLAKKLQAAGGGGSDGGGGAVIAELSAEKEKLQESVEKLKKNGELVMSKLKETNQDAKKSKDAMEKMKKQREKVRRKDSRVRVCLSSIPVSLLFCRRNQLW